MATPIPPNRAPFTAWSVAAATGGAFARGDASDAAIAGVTTDSRAVREGSAFVALRGETHDGHDYLDTAIERGARLVVIEEGRALPSVKGGAADVVVVKDTLRAWGDLASAHLRAWRRARPALEPARIVAITGSAGKTTTKELCAALLTTCGPCHFTAGNLNNRIGAPAVVLGLEPAHRFAVLEMGMSLPGEIAALTAIAPPDVALLLNVGVAHAEGLGGGRAAVAREKGAVYESLAPSGVAVVNLDDAAAAAQIARSVATREATFGRAAHARYRLVDRASLGARGSRLVVSRAGEELAFDFPLVGEAAAIDLVAALAAAEAASGVTFSAARIAEACAALAPVAGRAVVRTLEDGAIVLDDSYNANPGSMRAALATLQELAAAPGNSPRRAVAVLGEMKELGAAAEDEHARLGDALAAAGVALVIGCGGMIDVTLARAEAAGVAVIRAENAAEAAEHARANVGPRDVVLVKGSRSVQTEKVVQALQQSRASKPNPTPQGAH